MKPLLHSAGSPPRHKWTRLYIPTRLTSGKKQMMRNANRSYQKSARQKLKNQILTCIEE